MKKRIHKTKPSVVILGTTLAITAIATSVAIVYQNNELSFNPNLLTSESFEKIPGFNLTNDKMFSVKPNNISRFSFNSVRKGTNVVTPYGWIGVADNAEDRFNEIALINWSGEVIWRTKLPLAALTKIHDIKYDIGTNVIYVLASNKQSGAFDTKMSNEEADTNFFAIDAVKGTILKSESWLNGSGRNWLIKARKTIDDRNWGKIDFSSDTLNDRNWRLKDLYNFEVVSSFDLTKMNFGQRSKALVAYMPNLMMLPKDGELLTMGEIFEHFHLTHFVGTFDKNAKRFSGNIPHLLDILKNNTGNDITVGSDWKWIIDASNNMKWAGSASGDFLNIYNSALLANPFWSANPSGDSENYFLHFFFGSKDLQKNQPRTYHAMIKFDGNLKPIGSAMEQLQGYNVNNPKLPLFVNGVDQNKMWFKRQDALPKELWLNYPPNLRFNHNLFKPNIGTFAYPYQQNDPSGWMIPIWNVAQVVFDNNGMLTEANGSALKSKVLNLGKDQNLTPKEANQFGTKYGRLASVNPFDNSFVYFGNLKVNDVIGGWIVRGLNRITNKELGNGFKLEKIDGSVTDNNKLWEEGFSFDPQINREEINLYFNQKSNQSEYGAPSGFKTNPIGFVGHFQQQNLDNFTITNVTNANIDRNSTIGLLFSRPDLATWYSKTKYNIDNPANFLGINATIVNSNQDLNPIKSDWKPSQQDNFAVGVVSHSQKSATNDRYRAIRSAGLFTSSEKNSREQLKIVLSWDFADPNTINSQYSNLYNNWSDANGKMRYRITKDVNNASYQILNKFGHIGDMMWEHKADRWNGTLTNLNLRLSNWSSASNNWWDIRNEAKPGSISTYFGKIRNATNFNNQVPLRVLAQLVLPQQVPTWLNDFKNQKPQYWQPAPVSNVQAGETNFNELMRQFNQDLIKAINNQPTNDLNTNNWGLANLKMRLFYDLNPDAANGKKIYQSNNQTHLMTDANGKIAIYQDLSSEQDGLIYDQSATSFSTMKDQGLNPNAVVNNWLSKPNENNSKLLIDADVAQMKWPIVDSGASFVNKEKIFQASYDQSRQNLIIKAQNANQNEWFKQTITTMNFKYGLNVQFEGQRLNQTGWQNLMSSQLDDQGFLNAYQNNQFSLATNVNDFKKIRIKLVPIATSDPNQFISWQNVSEQKLTSAEVLLGASAIKFDPNWITNSPFTTTHLINQLDKSDFDNWLNTIKPKFEQANVNVAGAWSKMEVVYWFENQAYTWDNLVTHLRTLVNQTNRNDQGWWYLWVGDDKDKNGLKITAEFRIQQRYQNDFDLVDVNNNVITSEQTKRPINTSIKRQFDFQPYFAQLQQNPLVATGSDGNLSQIEFPNGQSGLFNQLDFATILQKSKSVGIKWQFMAATKSGWTNQWVDDLALIKTYNPADPKIKIKLGLESVYTNTQAVVGQQIIDGNYQGIELALQLPKLIQVPADFATQLKQMVEKDQIFSNNTKFLTLTKVNEFETKLKQLIKNASGFQDDLFNQFIKLSYDLGGQNLWLSANDLKNQLQQANSDVNDNRIDFKIELINVNQTHPEYVLDQNAKVSVELLGSQNQQVKIYVHGSEWEANIDKIKALGNDRSQISYEWPTNVFDDVKAKITKGVKLEWRFKGVNDQWKNYPDQPLPTNIVEQYPQFINVNEIEIQLSHDPNDKIHHYGPQQDQNPTRKTGIIDLSKLQHLVQVDPGWFKQVALVDQIKDWTTINNIQTFTNWETNVKNLIDAQVDAPTKAKIKIEYNVVWPKQTSVAYPNWVDANGIINLVNNAMSAYGNNEHQGLISFYDQTNGNDFQTKIVAKFKVDPQDQITLVNQQNQPLNDQQLQGLVNSDQIETTIDLSNYWKTLLGEITTLVVEDPNTGKIKDGIINPPNVSGASQIFQGQTFSQMQQYLANYGIKWVFNANVAPNENPNWVENGSLDHYNPQIGKIQVALINQSTNLKIKLRDDLTLAVGKDNKNETNYLKLQVPKLIDLQASWFAKFKNDHGFNGNTKHLNIDQSKINQLQQDLISELIKINPDLKDAPLIIKFQLGSTTWWSANELKQQLANESHDQSTTMIKMQVSLQPTTSANDWILTGYGTQQGGVDVFDGQSPLKIFLHDQGIWSALNAPQLSGTNQNLQWQFKNLTTNPVSGIISQPDKQGALKIQYRLNPSDQWQDRQITSFPAGQSTMQIQLTWAIANGEQKFAFEDSVLNSPFNNNAKQITYNSNINKAINVDLSKLKSTLVLKSEWLSQIKATGNLINLKLDETQFRQILKDQQVLVGDELNNLVAQYSIDGKNWLEKDQFETFLKTNNGKESDQRFILKREAIKVRYGLKANIDVNKYGWQIDGITIQNEQQFVNYYKQLIDQQHNHQVLGVINLDLVPAFTKTNFWIRGTNLKPKLEVKNAQQMINKFSPYQSEHLFRIVLTNVKTGGGAWDWTNAIPIWQNGQFIEQLGLTFKDLKNAAIKFEAFDPSVQDQKYQVQQNGQLGSDYYFDISDQIKVVTEIINPFSAKSKKLAIQVRNDQNKAQWMQNQGQFKIMVGDSNWQIDSSKQSAWSFLEASQDLTTNEKSKLEFAYTIFKSQPTSDEILQAQQDLEHWSAFKDANNWSGDLKLKVGDYVMVALRVKAEFASGEQGFVLKDNDHSFLIPVNDQISDQNQPIAKRQPGRISGLLIDPESAQVQDNVLLKATNLALTDQLIDGWVQLDQIQINNEQNQAQGLDLSLELFTTFHLDDQNQILVSGSQSLLVERDATNATQGAQYVDQSGKPIVDKNQKPVHLLIDNTTKKLAKPLEATQASRTIKLISQTNGAFKFVLPTNEDFKTWALFKNQKVMIKYQAKVGLGDQQNPDFELTKAYQQDLKDFINPQIKFVLENPQNIVYEWANRNEFADGIVQFEATDNSQVATDGAAKVKTILKLNRKLKNDATQSEQISGANGESAASAINAKIKDDFSQQIQFQLVRIDRDGNQTSVKDSANWYQWNDLKNGEQLQLKLITTDEDLLYLDAPQDLIINVNGLATVAPDRAALRFLRVEQSGKIDGQGSFRVLVNDPNGAINNSDQILKGWKFLIRVWDRSKTIKINWTDDQSLITNLNNGDRVEWKLVDANKNPVTDAYYNTIAITHDEANGIYNYGQVNYPNGQSSLNVIKNEIGSYPLDESQYPETSGFVISNLVAKDQIKPFNLTQFAFEKIIKTLNPTYYGQNGNGALRFNEQYLSGTWYIDLEGNIYQEPKYQNQAPTQALQEITLENFFANTTFYLDNPVTNPAQVGFKFKANLTNTGNQLKNGDQVYAQFDIEGAGWSAITGLNDNDSTNNDQVLTSTLVTQLPDVNKLVESTDPLSAFWWILITIATLGFGGLIWALVNKWKNPKLKVKEF